MTSFTDLNFLFRFLPALLLIYYMVPMHFREVVLLLGSLVFYGVGEPVFVALLLLLTVINYLLAKGQMRLFFKKRKAGSAAPEGAYKGRNGYSIFGVILNVAVLAGFKGFGFWSENALLPLGLSFYIFKMISFQIDLARRQIEEPLKFRSVALYFTLFPQVISGPIMRYELGDFGYAKRFDLEQIGDGLSYMVMGLSMKVLLADRLAIMWNDLQMIGYISISTPLAWLGMLGYSLQLYFDFWGYSLMAAGILMMFGYEFVENFNHPYGATSVSEFYRRWHVTLGNFFRDYVYIPMGGSRCGKGRTIMNLAVVWLLTGIWHGSGVHFVVWGGVLGLLIMAEKLCYGKLLKKVPVLGHLYVWLVIPHTWMIFAIPTKEAVLEYMGRLFPFMGAGGVAVNPEDILLYGSRYGLLLLAGLLLCIPPVYRALDKRKRNPIVVLLLCLLFWISVYMSANTAGNPFMYFDF